MRGLCFLVGALAALSLFGCARFELTGTGGGGGAPVGGDPSTGGAPANGGAPVGGDPTMGGAPPCDQTDFESDPLNCGSCGHDCYGGDCIGATCQFEELWSSSADNGARFAQGITLAEDRVVWVCDAGTLSLPVTARAGTMPIIHSTHAGTRVAYKSPLIYRTWGTLITTPLSADVSDDAVENEEDGVWGSGQCSYDIAVDGTGETFCVNSVNSIGSVYRYNASFTASQVLSDMPGIFGVALDDTYFYAGFTGGIWRQERPPSNQPGEIVFAGNIAAQLLRHGDSIYFGTSNGLYRYDLADGGATELYASVAPNSIHVDAQHIWFTNQDDEQVWRVDLDGQNPQTWGIGGGHPDVIAGDDLFVFVTTDEDGRVTRLAK